MKFTNAESAEVLVGALPYIEKYAGKTIVVKYGGNAMKSEELKLAVMHDIVLLRLIGVNVVLVHGGGPEISAMMERLGKKSKFIRGLRVTDSETADIVQMVTNKINKRLVNMIGAIGGTAVGLSGTDAHMIRCSMLDPELGYVGKIERIKTGVITDLLDKGYIQVISTVGYDPSGQCYNINADTAAAGIAAALNAECLFSMTDIQGLMRDLNDPYSLIREATVEETEEYKKSGIISGGMIPKVQCCIDALNAGVNRAFIIDGRVPHALLIEMLTNEGMGTMFVRKHGTLSRELCCGEDDEIGEEML